MQLQSAVFLAALNPKTWQGILDFEKDIRDYFWVIGLELFLDEAEGYAFLKHRNWEPDEEPLPRLVDKRPLSYPVSLLCVLLRKRLLEADAGGGLERT